MAHDDDYPDAEQDPCGDVPLASAMQQEYQQVGAFLRGHVSKFLGHMNSVVAADPDSLAKPETLQILAEVAVHAYHLERDAANLDRRIESERRKLEREWD
jgi:hypothetical protein